MTPLREKFVAELRLQRYARNTIRVYVDAVKGLAAFHGRSPEKIGFDEVRDYVRQPMPMPGIVAMKTGPPAESHSSIEMQGDPAPVPWTRGLVSPRAKPR